METRNVPAVVRQARGLFSRESNAYAGSDVTLARRFALAMWPAGTAVMLALVPFFPPTKAIGAWGWLLLLQGTITSAVGYAYGRRHLDRISYNWLLVAGYHGLINLALIQWLGGGRPAPTTSSTCC
jgi:hypothetical protein